MNMISDIISLRELFELQISNIVGLDTKTAILNIPIYQREYTWEQDRIVTLIKDIKNDKKFLGILTCQVNKDENKLEFVDGQQRITTLFLCIICLHELMRKENRRLNMDTINSLILKDGKYILQNDSVGAFLQFDKENGIYSHKLVFNPKDDIYKQESVFRKAYTYIHNELKSLTAQKLEKTLHNILDSKVAIIINIEESPGGAIEEVYIDINEKAQQLGNEDIFKAYCFAKTIDKKHHKKVQTMWTEIKKNAFKIRPFHFKNLDEFLSQYMLSIYYKQKINDSLKVDGFHILSNDGTDDIIPLMEEMCKYQEDMLLFYNNINRSDYTFNNILARTERINSDELNDLKYMANHIYKCKQNIFKLPFFMYVHKIQEKNLKDVTFFDFKAFIYLYYIYSFIFNNIINKKNRGYFSGEIMEVIMSGVPSKIEQKLREQIKTHMPDKFSIQDKANLSNLPQLYEIIDTYKEKMKGAQNLLSLKHYGNGTTQEHFIINKSLKIKCVIYDAYKNEKQKLFDLDETDFSSYVQYKKQKDNLLNFIWISQSLNNNELCDYDIVEKIRIFKSKRVIPTHTNIFIDYIEGIDSYQNLAAAINDKASKEVIIAKYIAFFQDYFETHSASLYSILTKAFQDLIKTL